MPVEVLNIVIPMHELADGESLVDTLIGEICADISEFGYFEIISFLFLCKGHTTHSSLVNRLFSRSKDVVDDSLGPRIDSQAAHLCLDILSCPYIPVDRRGAWFNNLQGRCGLPTLSRADAQAAVSAIEANPWFVRWGEIDLLSMLRKKELSDVY